jgi:cell division protein FtsB
MVHNARVFSSRTSVVVIIVGVLLLVAFAFVREYVRNIDIATELERMQAENESLHAERLASLELISQLSTQTAVEFDARTKFNLAAEGEALYVVQDDSPTDVDAGDQSLDTHAYTLVTDPSVSNSLRWFLYFFAPESFQESGVL